MATGPKYLDATSTQTLRDGLDEYYAVNSGLLDPDGLESEVAEAFRRHDIGHVVFGCDTSLRGEALIDTWTIFGASVGLRGYLQYFRYPQVNQIFAEAGYLRITLESLRCLPDLLRVIARSRRQRAKWPWDGYESQLDRELCEIRREFNIRPV